MELKKSYKARFWIIAAILIALVVCLIFWVTSYDTLQQKFLLIWVVAAVGSVTCMLLCALLGYLIHKSEKGAPLTLKDLNVDIIFYLEKESVDKKKSFLNQWGHLYRISYGKESLLLADWGLFEEGEYTKEAGTERIQKVLKLDIGKKKIIKKKVLKKPIKKPVAKKTKKKTAVKKPKEKDNPS